MQDSYDTLRNIIDRATEDRYQLRQDEELPPITLSEYEIAVMIITLKKSIASNNPIETAATILVLEKIVEMLPSNVVHRVDSLHDLMGNSGLFGECSAVDTHTLISLSSAIRSRNIITFNYTDAHGKATYRRVQPYDLTPCNWNMYLVAYDLNRLDWRTFRLDRVSNVVRSKRTFKPIALPDDYRADYDRRSGFRECRE